MSLLSLNTCTVGPLRPASYQGGGKFVNFKPLDSRHTYTVDGAGESCAHPAVAQSSKTQTASRRCIRGMVQIRPCKKQTCAGFVQRSRNVRLRRAPIQALRLAELRRSHALQ